MAASRRRVVIDDTDSRIHYSGQGWFQDQGTQDNAGNFGPTYKRTSHGTTNNDSLSFSFEGTSIALMGTTQLARIDNDTRFDPSWECFVDQISIGATKPFEFTENNWLLCEHNTLNNGPHTFTVNVTTAGKTFWVDYLIFTPPASASFDEAVLIVQNDEPGIMLDSKWGALGGTANMTTVKGSQAKFDFIGKGVTWVGFVPTELPHPPASGSFSIDGGPPTSFKLNGLPADGKVTVYNQAFFTTPELEPGPHSLIVTYNGADEPATPLTLDYLYVTNTTIRQSVESSGSPTPNPSSTNIGSNAQNQRSSTPIGAIVGGVVGGLGIILLVVLLLLLRRRRQRRQTTEATPGSVEGNATLREVTPFMAVYPPLHDPTFIPPPGASRPYYGGHNHGASGPSFLTSPSPLHSTQPSTSSNNISHLQSTSMDTSNTSGDNALLQPRPMHKNQIPTQPNVTSVLHKDSGFRLATRGSNITEDVPPVYTAN